MVMQTKLEEQGYSCGEEETEDIIYGDGTESAVVTLQVGHLYCLCFVCYVATFCSCVKLFATAHLSCLSAPGSLSGRPTSTTSTKLSMTFTIMHWHVQACAGLPESGVADAATWAFLMEDNHPGGHSSSADGHAVKLEKLTRADACCEQTTGPF